MFISLMPKTCQKHSQIKSSAILSVRVPILPKSLLLPSEMASEVPESLPLYSRKVLSFPERVSLPSGKVSG